VKKSRKGRKKEEEPIRTFLRKETAIQQLRVQLEQYEQEQQQQQQKFQQYPHPYAQPYPIQHPDPPPHHMQSQHPSSASMAPPTTTTTTTTTIQTRHILLPASPDLQGNNHILECSLCKRNRGWGLFAVQYTETETETTEKSVASQNKKGPKPSWTPHASSFSAAWMSASSSPVGRVGVGNGFAVGGGGGGSGGGVVGLGEAAGLGISGGIGRDGDLAGGGGVVGKRHTSIAGFGVLRQKSRVYYVKMNNNMMRMMMMMNVMPMSTVMDPSYIRRRSEKRRDNGYGMGGMYELERGGVQTNTFGVSTDDNNNDDDDDDDDDDVLVPVEIPMNWNGRWRELGVEMACTLCMEKYR
jgi:hypothetical protein